MSEWAYVVRCRGCGEELAVYKDKPTSEKLSKLAKRLLGCWICGHKFESDGDFCVEEWLELESL